jgi:hypothetical protein
MPPFLLRWATTRAMPDCNGSRGTTLLYLAKNAGEGRVYAGFGAQ